MVHIKCNSTTLEEYIQIQEASDGLTDEEIQAKKWKCSKCVILNLAKNFPFGQQSNYELINIINNDTMKALETLSSYDIVSKASDFESLKQADIDENIITNINSRYYPVHEFNKLNRENYFNIFHTNINGLENKFDLLHNLINSTELDVDLIAISETSQKEKHNRRYRLPFYTGSKTSRGGVAIYTNNDLSVFERDDLKVMDVNTEVVWIEIEVEKGKNIICGCVYRHPIAPT